VRTDGSPSLTLVQGGDGEDESGSASTIFGHPSLASTILPTTPPQLHTESLNDLVKIVDDLVSRYFEVCATFIIATKHLAKAGRSGSATITIEGESNA
jgi:hypothetical protein